MLITSKAFRLKAEPLKDMTGYFVTATSETIGSLREDDTNSEQLANDVEVISSLSTLRKQYIYKVIIQIMIDVFFWALTAYALHNAVLHGIDQDHFALWVMYAAVPAVFAILFFPGAFNPVVHDIQGHWVNLRSGSSNLNGGCVLKKG